MDNQQITEHKTNFLRLAAWILIFLTIGMLWIEWFNKFSGIDNMGDFDDAAANPPCNVAGVTLYGPLTTYQSIIYDPDGNEISSTRSDEVVRKIRESVMDEEVKAIVLEIDSRGGSPVAAEEVANALKRSTKPTVALIRESGTSAAYWAATGAKRIYAFSTSDVGGIGVTFSYLDKAQKNQKEGFTYNQLSVGKFKDSGDPDKPLTEEERQLFMRDLETVHDFFIQSVASNRNITIDQVRLLADGSSMPGIVALRHKLIDAIGDIHDIEIYLKKFLQLEEDIEICWRE